MGFKIYTKTGDAGETALYGGQRVGKDDLRIEAYGTVDELNSHIGLLLARLHDDDALGEALAKRRETETVDWRGDLEDVQRTLFTIGSQLATPSGKTVPVRPIGPAETERLERAIDRLDADLPSLTSFILPAGGASACEAHVCRTVTRRAERCVVRVTRAGEPVDPAIIVYLNRLSDYFFTLARAVTAARGEHDTAWVAGD